MVHQLRIQTITPVLLDELLKSGQKLPYSISYFVKESLFQRPDRLYRLQFVSIQPGCGKLRVFTFRTTSRSIFSEEGQGRSTGWRLFSFYSKTL